MRSWRWCTIELDQNIIMSNSKRQTDVQFMESSYGGNNSTNSHPDESLSSLKWREQINNYRFEERREREQQGAHNKFQGGGGGGLGPELIKLCKKATYEKKAFKGKRKPLGNVSNGSKILQSKAAAKRELQKIHSKLPEMC